MTRPLLLALLLAGCAHVPTGRVNEGGGRAFPEIGSAQRITVITGTPGDDVLIGSPGDTMTGGSGADAFALHVDGNVPIVITDFTPGEDVLHLEAEYGDLEGVTNFTQEVLADGSGLKISLPTPLSPVMSTVRLVGATRRATSRA